MGFALGVVSWIQFIAAWVHYIIFGVLSLVLSWGYINLIDAYFISTFSIFYQMKESGSAMAHADSIRIEIRSSIDLVVPCIKTGRLIDTFRKPS